MDVAIRQNPAFAVARCQLASGEGMKAGAGAMMAHSIGVELEAKVQGGLMKGLKRSILGGESLFQTTWTAPDGGGWVDCTANLPGDLAVLDVDGVMNVTQGAARSRRSSWPRVRESCSTPATSSPSTRPSSTRRAKSPRGSCRR
jgi:uncharacterized protein (AIM24 family)